MSTAFRAFTLAAIALSSTPEAASGAPRFSVQFVEAADGADFDSFGLPVAIDGDVLLAAAIGAETPAGRTGAVYVYALDDGRWVARQKLVPPDGDPLDEFGTWVAIDGRVAAVGAPRDDDLGNESGAAYVYRLGTGGWTLDEKLVASDGGDLQFFGHRVALGRDALVVGAPAYATDEPGRAYVFRHDGERWVEEQILEASDGEPGDFFGSAGLALEGDLVLVAAERHHHAPGSGSVFPFHFDGSRWVEGPEIRPVTGAPTVFGRSLALEGDVAVVGSSTGKSPLEDGVAYVFRRTGLEGEETWSETQLLLPSDPSDLAGEGFGSAVAISCGVIFAASPYHCHEGPCPGSVDVFRPDGEGWRWERELTPDVEGVAYDFFGHSVAADFPHAVVGAPGTNTARGADAGVAYAITVTPGGELPGCP